MNFENFSWTNQPKNFSVEENKIEIVTEPNTDLWQKTFYDFESDNVPMFQMQTEEKNFAFTVKVAFDGALKQFDQCGIVMHLDSDNWLKASIEYDNENVQQLGSVVTNNGYCDWATTEIPTSIKSMWYRFIRKNSDYCIECSKDGKDFKQMRICHMFKGAEKINFGIYACSPSESSFKAIFTDFNLKIGE